MDNRVCIGRVCYSKAGRDKGNIFIIKEILDENYVLIVDGVLRKVYSPKKKKLKHLELRPEITQTIAEKFKWNKKVFDAEIRSAIISLGYSESNNKEM